METDEREAILEMPLDPDRGLCCGHILRVDEERDELVCSECGARFRC